MDSHIRDPLEPKLSLVIEIRIVQERTAVDEIAAHIANGPLDVAFGLRAIGPACTWGETPVVGEPEKLGVAYERSALEPQIPRDHRLHLIEEQLLRDASEIANASSSPSISVAMS
jgi:hypothetical protein